MMHGGIIGAAKLGKVSLERSESKQMNHCLTVITVKETSGMCKSMKMIPFSPYHEWILFLNADRANLLRKVICLREE